MRRDEVFARDEYRCVYCGERFEPAALTVDHVEPRMRGGDASGGNLVTACGPCNARKRGRRAAAFLRDEPAAVREGFFLRTPHLWPRIRRTIEDELHRPAARPRDLDG